MNTIDCIQGSDEWFMAKLGKVSASHFSDVLCKGSGRKTYMYRLLGERLSGEPYESYSNKTMERGEEVEGQARVYYEQLNNLTVSQVGFVELNENIGCSPDGLIGDSGGIEIKCPYPSTHARYIIENKLPACYRPQVQGNLWVTGREWWDFVSFDPRVKDRPFWCIRIERDEKYINVLKEGVNVFVEELKELVNQIKGNIPY